MVAECDTENLDIVTLVSHKRMIWVWWQVEVAIEGQGKYQLFVGTHFYLSVGERQVANSDS